MSIKLRRRSTIPAGYIPDYGPPALSASHVWWAGDLGVDGSNVTSWTDRVGAIPLEPGYRVDNPTTYPVVSDTGFNGQKSVEFTNLSTTLVADGLSFATDTGSLIIVGSVNTLNSGNNLLRGEMATLQTDGVSTSFKTLSFSQNTPTETLVSPLANGGASIHRAIHAGDNVPTAGTPFIVEISSPLGDVEARRLITFRSNNVTRYSYMSVNGTESSWSNLDQLILCGHVSGAEFVRGTLGNISDVEVINIAYVGVFPEQISSGDRTTLYDWLGTNYGITTGTYTADAGFFPPSITDALHTIWASDSYENLSNTTTGYADRKSSLTTSSGSVTFNRQGLKGRPSYNHTTSNKATSTTSGLMTHSAGSVVFIIRPASTATTQTLFAQGWSSSPNYYLQFIIGSDGKMQIAERNNNTADIIKGDTVLNAGELVMLEYSSNGSAYSLRVNNVDQTLTTVSGANNGQWFNTMASKNRYCFGGFESTSTTPANRFSGRLVYALFTTSVLSSGDRTKLMDWMNGYYDLNALPYATPTLDVPIYAQTIYPIIGQTVNFSATPYEDDGTLTSRTLDWGDGSSPVVNTSASGVTQSNSYAYTSNGSYELSYTLLDNDSGTKVYTYNVEVAPNAVPVIVSDATVTAAGAGSIVDLSLVGTYDLQNFSDDLVYDVDWGDGSAIETLDPADPQGSHFYTGSGDRTIEVTVTDLNSGVATEDIIVTLPALVAGPTAPSGTTHLWWAEDTDGTALGGYGPADTNGDYVGVWYDRVAGVPLLSYVDGDTDNGSRGPLTWYGDGFNGHTLLQASYYSNFDTDTVVPLYSESGAFVALVKTSWDSVNAEGSTCVFDIWKEDGFGITGSLGFNLTRTSSTEVTIQLLGSDGTDNYAGLATVATSDTYLLIEVGSDGTDNYVRVNNVSQTIVANGTGFGYLAFNGFWTSDIGTDTNQRVVLRGNQPIGLQLTSGDGIAFVLNTNTVPSSQDRLDLVDWCETYYGITL